MLTVGRGVRITPVHLDRTDRGFAPNWGKGVQAWSSCQHRDQSLKDRSLSGAGSLVSRAGWTRIPRSVYAWQREKGAYIQPLHTVITQVHLTVCEACSMCLSSKQFSRVELQGGVQASRNRRKSRSRVWAAFLILRLDSGWALTTVWKHSL